MKLLHPRSGQRNGDNMAIIESIKRFFTGKTEEAPPDKTQRAETIEVYTAWRDSVLKDLTPERLANVLIESANGDLEAYLVLAEELEEHDMHYASVLGTRKRALSACSITVSPASDEERDVAIADAVREMFKGFDSYCFLEDIMDAVGKGFSVHEIEWDTTGVPWKPKPRWKDPRHFQVDRDTLSVFSYRDGSADGVPLSPYSYIIHVHRNKSGAPIRNGLARLVAFGVMCKSYSFKDWMTFLEIYGIPWRIGKYSPGAPKEERAALRQAIISLGHDAGAIIPDSMAIDFLENASNSDGALFRTLGNEIDAQVSKAVLGQTMTADAGGSYAQATIHNLVRKDILTSDIQKVIQTITLQLITPFVKLNFGADTPLPTVSLLEPGGDSENLNVWTMAVSRMVDNGVRIEEAQVLERMGLDEPAEGARLLTPRKTGGPEDTALSMQRYSDNEMAAVYGGDDWHQYDAMWAPIIKALNSAKSSEEFDRMLEDALVNGVVSQDFILNLAKRMYLARGSGNTGE
jgi:phage gp29-like protein